LKPVASEPFWRRADFSALAKTMLIGLVVGVTVRWMAVSTPPLPALAQHPEQTETAPAAPPAPEVKTADASPSDRR
jgi:hypothetical protein